MSERILWSPRKPDPLPECDGSMWVSFPVPGDPNGGRTVLLDVLGTGDDAVVVGCPPYAYSWAMGAKARKVWDRAVGQGAKVRWLPAK